MGGAIAKVTRPKMLFMAQFEIDHSALGVKSPFFMPQRIPKGQGQEKTG